MDLEEGNDLQRECVARTEIARKVFEYWKQITKHPRSCLDEKRMKLVTARIKDGYTERDLKLASFGCKHSRWHQGENDRNTVYDSVELIYKNADQVDKFMRLGEQELERRKRAKQLEEMTAAADLAASTTGETYKRERGRLLSIVKK